MKTVSRCHHPFPIYKRKCEKFKHQSFFKVSSYHHSFLFFCIFGDLRSIFFQVVTLAVYSYFLVTVIGTQVTSENDSYTGSLISFPFMQILEFVFYMGWLKVAECLINPYGEDDDDFEVMWMIDRHLQVSIPMTILLIL